MTAYTSFGLGVQRAFIASAIVPSTTLGYDKPNDVPMRGAFEVCEAVRICHARLGRGGGRSVQVW